MKNFTGMVRAAQRPVLLLAALFLFHSGISVHADTTAAAAGFSQERLDRVGRTLQQYVDDGRIAGAVTLILRDGVPVYERAVGWSDKEAKAPMRNDTIFRIASQTKALTSAAALILLEEGKLSLQDPVSRFIPEFAKTTVAIQVDGKTTLQPAQREITLFDLFTHTAGISYGTEEHIAGEYQAKGLGPAAGHGWYVTDKNEPVCATMQRLATVPFVAQPGSAWKYGYGTDILGCVIERASGQTLDDFMRTRITAPLSMNDTYFFLPQAKKSRLATVYGSDSKGLIERAPAGSKGQGHFAEGPQKNFSGGAGLVSTAQDYARFLEMLRRGGELDGRRILSPRSVALMRTNQVGSLHSQQGLGFGLGFQTVERYGATSMASVGSYGWGGAYGSQYHVDPKERLVAVLMIQLMPNKSGLQKARFLDLTYQALMTSPDSF
jgi:CubicO group peptidase (beta-lactamase class C family)